MRIRKVAIVGAGTMGCSIAENIGEKGFQDVYKRQACIYALTVFYRSYAGSVAQVAAYDPKAFRRPSEQLCSSTGNVSMRCAVETIPSYFVTLIKHIGKCVKESVLRHGLMECGVKDSYLGHTGYVGFGSQDPHKVCRIVERT